MKHEQTQLSPKRLAQNLIPIFLMLTGITLAIFESWLGWSDFIYPVWSIALTVCGMVLGVFFAYRRDVLDKGKPGRLVVTACICWAAMILAIALLLFFPHFYGLDLEILFNSMAAIFWSGLLGIIFTIAALLK